MGKKTGHRVNPQELVSGSIFIGSLRGNEPMKIEPDTN
jgi:hypothetical protein